MLTEQTRAELPDSPKQLLQAAGLSLLQAVQHHTAHQLHRRIHPREQLELVCSLPNKHGVARHDCAAGCRRIPAGGEQGHGAQWNIRWMVSTRAGCRQAVLAARPAYGWQQKVARTVVLAQQS